MQHTLKVTISAKDDGKEMLFDDAEFIIDGATGFLRKTDDPPLLEWKAITLETTSTIERDYLLDTLSEWEIKIDEDPSNPPTGYLSVEIPENDLKDEVTYDFEETVAMTKEVLTKITQRFNKSRDLKERRFLKQVELTTKAFLEMVEGRERLAKLLGDVDVTVEVELKSTYEEPVVAPLQAITPNVPPAMIETSKPKSRSGRKRKAE